LSEIGSTFLPQAAQAHNTRDRRTVPGMLGRLQDRRGEPALRTRGMAALVLLGVLLLAAPGLIAVLHWAIHHLV
jgi:hypothetical protein